MDDKYSSYDFGFTRYTVKRVAVEGKTLVIDGVYDFATGRLLFEDLKDGFSPDMRMIGGKVFGIRRKDLPEDYVLFRIYFDDGQIEYADIIARDLIYKM